MNKEQMLLLHLMEECAEVSHRASKALRFGLSEVQKDQEQDNRQRLTGELIDLLAVVEILLDHGIIKEDYGDGAQEAMKAKRAKIEKYLAYSAELGIHQP